jgi:hypothetical protein
MAPSDIRTTIDKKFEHAKQIYATAERWHDAIVVLQELCCAIGDRTSSRNSLLEKSSFVKKFVIPLMSDSIVNITAAAKVLSPVPGIEYVHHRKECKRKQEILFSKSSTLSPGEELIVQYVKDSQHKNNQKNNRTPPTKLQCIIHACISPTENSDAIELPNPESGEAYTKGEIVNILSNVLIGDGSVRSRVRSQVVKAILDRQMHYNTPCSKTTIYRLFDKHANGINIFGECKGKGRPQICSDHDVKEIAESWELEVGKTYNRTDVELMLKKKQAATMEKAGFTNIIDRSISINTVNNYAAMLADESTIAISQSYIPKSNTRYAAENSIRGSIATLGVIASTHFINVDKEDDDIRAEIKSLPSGTRKMYDMATDYFGAAVYPVEPYLLYSTDDTTEYIFEGTMKQFVPYVLTSKTSIAKRSTNAVYKCEDNKSMSGMRVKLTFTFSAMGTCMPLVCTVTANRIGVYSC